MTAHADSFETESRRVRASNLVARARPFFGLIVLVTLLLTAR